MEGWGIAETRSRWGVGVDYNVRGWNSGRKPTTATRQVHNDNGMWYLDFFSLLLLG